MLPVAIDALKASVGFWCNLINAKEEMYASNAYKCSLNLPNGFAAKLKNALSKIGFSHVWENQNTFQKKKCLINAEGNKLAERYTDFCKNSLFNDQNNPNGNKLRT